MTKTSYYTDQDFERYMAHSGKKQKIQFYVWLGASLVVQPAIYGILFADNQMNFISRCFLVMISLLALVCLAGLWYSYRSTEKSIQSYRKMRQEQRDEVNALLDEVEIKRRKKLNQD